MPFVGLGSDEIGNELVEDFYTIETDSDHESDIDSNMGEQYEKLTW